MALSKLTSSDAGAAARGKINSAFDQIDALGEALQRELVERQSAIAQMRADLTVRDNQIGDALQREVVERQDTINQVQIDLTIRDNQLGDALQHEVIERQNTIEAFGRQSQAALDDLSKSLDDEVDARTRAIASTLLSVLAVASDPRRPGLCPDAFGMFAAGPVGASAPLDPSGRISTPFGAAYRIEGACTVAPRATTPLDIDAIKILQVRYWRLADVLDPNNNAVEIGIQWLDAADGDLGRTLIRQDRSLMARDGPHDLTVRVPSLTGSVPIIAAPKGTVSWRPYFRTYGSDGATAIGVLGVSDATFAGVYAPDVSAIAARLSTIEGQLAAGLPLTAPILPSYAVADLPKAGNRGRKAFALDGRAPNAAGSLEAANAGTGVEVTDNGTTWVIAGTNQQVQA